MSNLVSNNVVKIEKNKFFKIKSMYKDVYFDIQNDKLVLNKLTNSNSQYVVQ